MAKSKRPKKKHMIIDPVEQNEMNIELSEIKKIKSSPNERLVGRKPLLYIMYESGEDKVIAQKIFILAAKGYSRESIRSELDIKRAVWFKMMKKDTDEYPIYLSALTRGDDFAIEKVEEAMKSSALGYDFIEKHEGVDGDKYISKTITKHVKPDVKAQMFLLTNLKPDKYKMKRTEEININIKKDQIDWNLIPLNIKKLIIAASTGEERDKLIAQSAEIVDTVKKNG